ncbi:hypothetical protein IMCC9480_1557 [Oxalobacteraceae bacterium IMCC9480]|jgi:hypothetical protein|nr:hypothetical protein IMCC9480_1557 [Oxalobacteraceae bacterium IMCC9480]
MRQQVAVNVDLLNQLALGQAAHEERLALHDAAVARNG